MKKNIIIWGTALILVILAIMVTKNYKDGKNKVNPQDTNQAVQTNSSQNTTTDNASTEGKLIDFTLTDLNGNKVSLADYKGKPVYLNFWATWCPPCRGEMPGIEKVYRAYKDKGLTVLAVDLGEDKGTVKDFIKQNNYSFTVLLDSDQSVAEKYNISAIPVSYFIDKEGNIAAKKIGALSEEDMKSYIESILK